MGTAAAVILGLVLVPWGQALHAVRELGGPSVNTGLNGFWRSQGYGWLWAIKDGRVSVYDESGSLCLAGRSKSRKLRHLARNIELSSDGRVLRLSMGDLSYRFTFDRIVSLPEACTRTPDAGPPAVIDAIAEISRHIMRSLRSAASTGRRWWPPRGTRSSPRRRSRISCGSRDAWSRALTTTTSPCARASRAGRSSAPRVRARLCALSPRRRAGSAWTSTS